MVSIEPNDIIVSEIVDEPSAPIPKNLIDVVGPLTPPKVDVAVPSSPPKDLVHVARPSMPPPENLC